MRALPMFTIKNANDEADFYDGVAYTILMQNLNKIENAFRAELGRIRNQPSLPPLEVHVASEADTPLAPSPPPAGDETSETD